LPINLVVIGGSAGGLPALLELVRDLPADLPAALCVVIHTSPYSPGRLPDIVERRTRLICEAAEDGQRIEPGHIYFAPVDRHLLIEDGRLRVTNGPRENGFRPAVDPLFRTAAKWHGPRVAGIVLSGSLGDGSFGLASIEQAGGVTIIQDPDEALVPSMPLVALRGASIDHIVKAADMASLIAKLAAEPSKKGIAMPQPISSADSAERGTALAEGAPAGMLTPLTCPECGGSLWEQEAESHAGYRCHVGHAYSAESLLRNHSQEVEGALWTALRVLEEHAVLQSRMASRAEMQGLGGAAEQFHERAVECRRQAEALRGVLLESPAAMFPAAGAPIERAG
jgi:two-component system, chemotaxis family, protein-glutamate methylesterase/glutaminase